MSDLDLDAIRARHALTKRGNDYTREHYQVAGAQWESLGGESFVGSVRAEEWASAHDALINDDIPALLHALERERDGNAWHAWYFEEKERAERAEAECEASVDLAQRDRGHVAVLEARVAGLTDSEARAQELVATLEPALREAEVRADRYERWLRAIKENAKQLPRDGPEYRDVLLWWIRRNSTTFGLADLALEGKPYTAALAGEEEGGAARDHGSAVHEPPQAPAGGDGVGPYATCRQPLSPPDPPHGRGPCARCGTDPARGFASVYTEATGDLWLCHEGESPTCYELGPPAPLPLTDEARETIRLVVRTLDDTIAASRWLALEVLRDPERAVEAVAEWIDGSEAFFEDAEVMDALNAARESRSQPKGLDLGSENPSRGSLPLTDLQDRIEEVLTAWFEPLAGWCDPRVFPCLPGGATGAVMAVLENNCATCGGSRVVRAPDCNCTASSSENYANCPHQPADCPDCGDG